MKSIIFVTGNKRKVWQAKSVLEKFDISVEPLDVNVTEIQSHDPLEITISKARAAYDSVKLPLVVCDHSWAFTSLRGFPGGYMKDINYWFETEDFLALLRDKKDRSIILTETVIFISEKGHEVFDALFPATVIDTPRGEGNVTMESIVVFDGQTDTIAEHIDKGEHARPMDNSAWQKFGEWYENIGNEKQKPGVQ